MTTGHTSSEQAKKLDRFEPITVTGSAQCHPTPVTLTNKTHIKPDYIKNMNKINKFSRIETKMTRNSPMRLEKNDTRCYSKDDQKRHLTKSS